MNKKDVYNYLDGLSIWYEVTEHEAVFNMDEFKSMYYIIERDFISSRYYDKYEQRGNVIMLEVFEYVKNKG